VALVQLGEESMEAVAQQTLFALPRFVPQDISNVRWLSTTLPLQHDAVLEIAALEAFHKFMNYETQDSCNAAWLFATVGYRLKKVMMFTS